MTIYDDLRCPVCHAGLALAHGRVRCLAHGDFVCGADGVLDFLRDGDEYFETHWSSNRQVTVPQIKAQLAEAFLSPALARTGNSGLCERWLDVGAGDGVHLSMLRKVRPDIECVGLDVSRKGLRSALQRAPGAIAIWADAMNIPLRDGSVDVAFSYGTLGYMPDPWRGLAELVRVTKPSGLIGVWFFPLGNSFLSRCFGLVRAVVPRLPRFLQARTADLIVPLLGWLPTSGGMSLQNSSWGACREAVLVNIAPPNLKFPSRDEIVHYFETLGCRVVEEDQKHPIAIWARRRQS